MTVLPTLLRMKIQTTIVRMMATRNATCERWQPIRAEVGSRRENQLSFRHYWPSLSGNRTCDEGSHGDSSQANEGQDGQAHEGTECHEVDEEAPDIATKGSALFAASRGNAKTARPLEILLRRTVCLPHYRPDASSRTSTSKVQLRQVAQLHTVSSSWRIKECKEDRGG